MVAEEEEIVSLCLRQEGKIWRWLEKIEGLATSDIWRGDLAIFPFRIAGGQERYQLKSDLPGGLFFLPGSLVSATLDIEV